MTMKLQIKSPGEGWRTLRTSEKEGDEKDYKYLRGQMQDWHQNYPDFVGSQYRIGREVDYKGSFEVYDPVAKAYKPFQESEKADA